MMFNIIFICEVDNKYLMFGPNENSECFPAILNVQGSVGGRVNLLMLISCRVVF